MIERFIKNSVKLVVGFVLTSGLANATNVTLSWSPAADTNVVGYVVECGTDGVTFSNTTDAGANTTATVTNVTLGATNYFAVYSYDVYRHVSAPSKAVSIFISNSVAVTQNGSDSQTNSQTTTGQTNSNSGGTNNNAGGGSGSASTGTSNDGSSGAASLSGTNVATNAATGFAIQVRGNGTLTPAHTLTTLQANKNYTLTAVPAKGSIFAGWYSNGVEVATSVKYAFKVQSNITLLANFVTNPFTPVVGTYHGLFYVTNNFAEDSSGSFTATVSSAGVFSAKLILAGQTKSLTGSFDANGSVTKSITRAGLTPLTVQMQLDLSSNGPITGTVSEGNWTADLVADRAIYSKTNAAPQAGKYTLVIPGNPNSATAPGGNGFGSVTVSSAGAVTLTGTLGDGTTLSSSSTVAADGQWPVYATLYGGKGSVLGWMTFTNDAINGQVGWFKLAAHNAKYYANGFTNAPSVLGSVYHYTNAPVLNFSSGTLLLTNADFPAGLSNPIQLSLAKSFADQYGTKLIFNTTSGLFTGGVTNPVTGKIVKITGAVLQEQNFGAGLFLGSDETGSVVLSPAQ